MAQKIINILFILIFFSSCRKDKGEIDYSATHYPQNIAKIISRNCAVAGCHNGISKGAAANLDLTSWETMFQGASNGSVVIPYRPDFSTLCFYTNTFSELGPTSNPIMPIGKKALSREEYLTLKNWILDGAPNNKGEIKFADNASRSKIYVTNQICGAVTVIDAESKLPMRYINVGNLAFTDFPYCVKVSSDKKYWYVTFLAYNGKIQKYDATNDSYTGQVALGTGVWSTFEISGDSKYAFCIDNSNPGRISVVDLDLMSVVTTYTNANFYYPKSAVINNTTKNIYVGAYNGNYISVVNYTNILSPVIKEIILDGTTTLNTLSVNDPANLLMDEINNRCYVSCSASNEIKVIDTNKDSVIATISLNCSPDMLSFSPQKKLLFVSCMNDSVSFSNHKGSVKIIDLAPAVPLLIATINTGYQPTGICVDETHQYVAVINSNLSAQGSAPHHVNGCGGRNGYVTFINLNSLALIPNKKFELASYPYSAAFRK